jgi:hypothetical protein
MDLTAVVDRDRTTSDVNATPPKLTGLQVPVPVVQTAAVESRREPPTIMVTTDMDLTRLEPAHDTRAARQRGDPERLRIAGSDPALSEFSYRNGTTQESMAVTPPPLQQQQQQPEEEEEEDGGGRRNGLMGSPEPTCMLGGLALMAMAKNNMALYQALCCIYENFCYL